MAMGWAVALVVVSLVLRHGAGAEALAWTVLFALTPFCAVYYPVSVLPAVMRPVALAMPVRARVRGHARGAGGRQHAWGQLAWAFGLNLVWLAAAAVLFMVQFRGARRRGALLTIGE